MDSHGHFSKFDQALADLARARPQPEARPYVKTAISAITNGQRFYVPDAAQVIQGRLLDSDLKSLIKLPFNCTVILSETYFNGVVPDGHETPIPLLRRMASWKITIAFDLEGDFNQLARLMDPAMAPGPGFGMLSMWFSPIHKIWVAMPGACFCHIRVQEDGYEIVPLDGPIARKVSLSSEMMDDATTAMNLCAMLGMRNVSTAERSPPAKVNKKRLSSGRRPLYSYHVLTVDGEPWDSLNGGEVQVGDAAAGIRSHLRRGHIRRLEGGAKMVWVRATYVQGGVPGFVDKSYKLTKE